MQVKAETVPSLTLPTKTSEKASRMEVTVEPVAISYLNRIKEFTICLILEEKMLKVMMELQEVTIFLFQARKERMVKMEAKPSFESHVEL